MQTSAIVIHGKPLLVEVDGLDDAALKRFGAAVPSPASEGRGVDLEETGAGGGADKLVDTGTQLQAALLAVAAPVAGALASLAPQEWTLEVNLGFKGEAGIPCVVKGEANGSLKVTVKWSHKEAGRKDAGQEQGGG